MQSHRYRVGISSDGLIYAIVDDFLRQMIGPGGIGIHTRSLAHRVQAAENLNRRGIVSRRVHQGKTSG